MMYMYIWSLCTCIRTIYTHTCTVPRFQNGLDVRYKGVQRLSMLDTVSIRGATTILDCMQLEITRIQIYRYALVLTLMDAGALIKIRNIKYGECAMDCDMNNQVGFFY